MLRQLLIATCALGMSLASAGALQVEYLCQMTGKVSSSCCCAGASDEGAQTAGRDQVKPGCCSRSLERVEHAPVTRVPEPLQVAAAQHIVQLSHAPRPQAFLGRVASPLGLDSRAPPGGPPVYARVCRYLI